MEVKPKGIWEWIMWALLISAFVIVLFATPPASLIIGADIPGPDPVAAEAYAKTVTDAEVGADMLNAAFEIVGQYKSGASGYVVAVAFLALLMRLTKWGRFSSLFDSIPRAYRSVVPIVLGLAIGLVEGQIYGTGWAPSLMNGLMIGGGQQLLYEQTKGTAIGKFIDAMPFPPKFVSPKRA